VTADTQSRQNKRLEQDSRVTRPPTSMATCEVDQARTQTQTPAQAHTHPAVRVITLDSPNLQCFNACAAHGVHALVTAIPPVAPPITAATTVHEFAAPR
jgi:hypothetical protein